ncbi:MAG: helix-turn-helix domain-containing protein [Anaerolineae bacterium]|nr:helix-turn-helix domain-containing protein [Anaerolineae bacterium]
MREIMTPQQVAAYLQVNTDTVYRLIRRRKLAASRIGRTYRIPKADLEDFLMAQSTRPEVREALFRRVTDIARRNPGLDSDRLLEELEQDDRQAQRR